MLLLDLAICGQHVAFHKIPLFWRLIVTPDMDRVFGSYTDQPAAGHQDMKTGLANYRNPKWLKLGWLLVVPASRYER